MSIRIIRKADIVARVPDRWANQYRGAHYATGDKAEIAAKLAALKGTPFTAAQCNEIIGNTSWTENSCSECGRDHDTLVRIGDEPDFEARWVDLCASCLAAAAGALNGASAA